MENSFYLRTAYGPAYADPHEMSTALAYAAEKTGLTVNSNGPEEQGIQHIVLNGGNTKVDTSISLQARAGAITLDITVGETPIPRQCAVPMIKKELAGHISESLSRQKGHLVTLQEL